MVQMARTLFLLLYYGFAEHLPVSYNPFIGKSSKKARYFCCKHLFAKCGKNVNVEHGADFESGKNIEIGDNSGLGIDSKIGMATIGDNVMMGPNVLIISKNHKYSDLDKPMLAQGGEEHKRVFIGDDCWIGSRVIILPGRRIGKGAVVGAGAVVTRDVPDFAVVGGNPARIIKYRQSPKP